jgi:hypothetical protein
MLKLAGAALALTALFLLPKPQSEMFSRYKSVETYEIRPGILMMPKYAEDGRVCEVTLEKHHYSNETASLGSAIPRETITQLVDELVPAKERGPLAMNFGKEYVSAYSGNSITTFAEYENVSIQIFGIASPPTSAGDVVAVIQWKNRGCRLSGVNTGTVDPAATTKPSH